ncbi:hypothetical protein TNCV_1357581 [Trichonephila clavipes]|uniref:Uncharacterized protein n=1 Tax=Trichonephila clavipes TaxID=2585209 RepID=A0A8X6SFN0_TRICX|nr:hypothetical protein TNCV_1357581 [Trichonephila clavipes]
MHLTNAEKNVKKLKYLDRVSRYLTINGHEVKGGIISAVGKIKKTLAFGQVKPILKEQKLLDDVMKRRKCFTPRSRCQALITLISFETKTHNHVFVRQQLFHRERNVVLVQNPRSADLAFLPRSLFQLAQGSTAVLPIGFQGWNRAKSYCPLHGAQGFGSRQASPSPLPFRRPRTGLCRSVSEFDRAKIIAYRECGLPFFGVAPVGIPTTVQQIRNQWVAKVPIERYAKSREDRHNVRSSSRKSGNGQYPLARGDDD